MQKITPFLWFDGKVEEAMNCASDRSTADIGRSYGSSSTPKIVFVDGEVAWTGSMNLVDRTNQ
jgi:hypothetical protein